MEEVCFRYIEEGGKKIMGELKNIYWRLVTSFREKKLKRQKALLQIKMMSGYIRRVK